MATTGKGNPAQRPGIRDFRLQMTEYDGWKFQQTMGREPTGCQGRVERHSSWVGRDRWFPDPEAGWQYGKSVGFGENDLTESWLHALALWSWV